MKNILFLLFCTSIGTVKAQYLKIDNGAVFSSFTNSKDLPILDSKVGNYSVQAGMDYGEHSWFSLSSQVGYLSFGGHETNPGLSQIGYEKVTEKSDWIQLNTTFRPYMKVHATTFFVGVGPTVSLLAGSRAFESGLYEGYSYNRLQVGSKAEIGMREDVKNFRFGLVGAYLRDFSPITKTAYISLYNQAFSVMFTTGYRFN